MRRAARAAGEALWKASAAGPEALYGGRNATRYAAVAEAVGPEVLGAPAGGPRDLAGHTNGQLAVSRLPFSSGSIRGLVAATAEKAPRKKPRRRKKQAAVEEAQETAEEQAAASLAPCERQPKHQSANELDQRLADAGRAGGAAAVLALVEQEGERFQELNVITALGAVAEACSRRGASSVLSPEVVVRSAGYQALVDMVLAGMMRFEPSLLAEAVQSCGQLGASDEMLLDEIGRHIMRFTHELGAADIAALVHGYSLLDHSPSVVLFDALAARAAQVTADFTAEQAAHVVAGYQRLGYTAKAPVLAHTPMLP